MADHTEFLELARELLSEEGRQVTFAKLDATATDPTKPWKGPGAPTLTGSIQAYAVFLPRLVSGGGFGKTIFTDELFKSSEQLLLVAPPVSGENLNGYSIVVDDGVRWTINVTEELKPANLTVLFAMGVSR